MSVLNALPEGEGVEVKRLKAIARATDGNLGAHLATLEKARFIAIARDFVGKRPRSRAVITEAGRQAFARHLLYLREIIAGEVPEADEGAG